MGLVRESCLEAGRELGMERARAAASQVASGLQEGGLALPTLREDLPVWILWDSFPFLSDGNGFHLLKNSVWA